MADPMRAHKEAKSAHKAAVNALYELGSAAYSDGWKAGWTGAVEEHERQELARLKEKYEPNAENPNG